MVTSVKSMRSWALLSLIVSMLLLGVSIAGEDHRDVRLLVESGEIQSLERILITIKEYVQGDILDVELEREHGKYIYEIEVLDDSGVVRELEIDAATGELLKMELGD